jgi:histidine triad (HIT) family protein
MTLFSRIISGEIPCHKVAESDRCFAFLDIRPIAKGHTLVVPKTETDYLFDLDEDCLADLVSFAKAVARGIDAATGCIRTGVIVQGLEVPHAHIHLVPLYTPHQKLAFGSPVEVTAEEMAALAAAIATEVTR